MFVVPMTGRATIVWPLNPPLDPASRATQAVAKAITEALQKQEAILTEDADGIRFESPVIAIFMRTSDLNGISSGTIYIDEIGDGIVIRCDLNAAPILFWAVLLICIGVILLHTPLFGANPRDTSLDGLFLAPIIFSLIKYCVTRASFPRWLRGRVLDALAPNPRRKKVR